MTRFGMAKAGGAGAGGQARVGDPPGEIRQVIPAFRWLLAPFVVLAFGAVGSLYLNPSRTDDFFSWTIEPPVTAALLGAAYGGTLVLFGLALRERVWADNRIVVTAPFVLSTLTLAATLIHLDKFHLHSDPLPATVAWIWLVVYVLVPPALVLLIVLQLRAPGSDPPRVAPLPAWMRLVLVAYGVASVVGGAVLFAVPATVARHWPWALTPLTGRAVAAWMVALGVAALQAAKENDVRRVRTGLVSFAVIGALGLIAVARFHDQVRWRGGGGWALVAALALTTAVGAYGWWLASRWGDRT